MAFYLGIDGGGTKTSFLLGNEHSVLAKATTEGSNLQRRDDPAVREAITAGIREICAASGTRATEITRTVAGLAGSSNAQVHEALLMILRNNVGGDIEIVGDMVVAHEAAFEGEAGVLVSAGTGSIAYGRNKNRETARAGGWGFVISDEGSGYWIGRLALAAAMRRHDAGETGGYLSHLMAALGVNQVSELAAIPASRSLSSIFPTVVEIAKLGDITAQEILRRAGEELALLGETVIQRLFANEAGLAIAAMGGVMTNSDIVFQNFAQRVQEQHPHARVWVSEAEPAMGALRMARQPRI